jgi:hypothetical protein
MIAHGENLEVIDERCHRIARRRFQQYAEQASRAGKVALEDRMVWMAGQSRVEHRIHLRLSLEPGGDLQRTAVVLLHADGQRA